MIQSYLANVHNLIESWALEMLNRGQIDFNKMFTDPMVKKKRLIECVILFIDMMHLGDVTSSQV